MSDQIILKEQAARVNAGRRMAALAGAALVWLLAATLLLTGMPAQAAEPEGDTTAGAETPVALSGVDFLQPDAQAWEILRVDHLGDKSLYLDVERVEGVGDSATVAPLLGRAEYNAAAPDSEAQGVGDDIARIIAVSMKGATPRELLANAKDSVRLNVTVYGERRGGNPLYEATVYPVYAQLNSGDEPVSYELLGLRTVQAGTAATTASKNIGAGLTFYKAAKGSDTPDTYVLQETNEGLDNGFDDDIQAFVVPYEKQAADAVKGSVRYVTMDGELVREDPVLNFENGQATARIETSFLKGSDDNPEVMRYFRVVSNLGGTTVTLTAANAHAVVRVVEVPQMAESDYAVSIRYEDENGTLLWSDKLDVKGYGYQYTLPTTFSMLETDGVEMYTLEGVEGAEGREDAAGRAAVRDWGAPTIRFDNTIVPQEHFLEDEGGFYLKAKYLSSEATRKAALTLVAVDGSTGERLPEAFQPGSFEVTPEAEARFVPEPLVVDGVTYLPWSGNTDEIVYSWESLKEGVDLLRYVYYVPEGFVPAEAYDVTVQYLDIATSAVLRTETVNVAPDMTEYLTLNGPETFSEGGNDYVRLAGQENGIRHGYYTPARTYTVYYRDVNDVINADTVIRRTQIIETERVVEVDGPVTTTVTAAPVTVPAAPAGGADADGAADGATTPATVDAGVGAGDGTTVINDDDNPLANQAGQDTTTERTIEDAETPLSAGTEPGSEESGSLGTAVAVGAAAVLIAAAAIAWVLLRRRSNQKTADALAESTKLNE